MTYVKKTYEERLKNREKIGKRSNIIITVDIMIAKMRKELYSRHPYRV